MPGMRLVLVCVAVGAGCGSSTITGNGPDAALTADARVVIDAPLVIVDAPLGGDAPGGGDGGVVCITGLSSLALAPPTSTVMLTGAAPAAIAFGATGTFTDQHTAAIAGSALSWSVSRDDDTPAGTISASGSFTPFADAGGVVTVRASDGCVSGTAKVTLLAAVTDDLVAEKKLNASDLVKKVAQVAGGSGGGKPHLALAGAKDPAKVEDALAEARRLLAEALDG